MRVAQAPHMVVWGADVLQAFENDPAFRLAVKLLSDVGIPQKFVTQSLAPDEKHSPESHTHASEYYCSNLVDITYVGHTGKIPAEFHSLSIPIDKEKKFLSRLLLKLLHLGEIEHRVQQKRDSFSSQDIFAFYAGLTLFILNPDVVVEETQTVLEHFLKTKFTDEVYYYDHYKGEKRVSKPHPLSNHNYSRYAGRPAYQLAVSSSSLSEEEHQDLLQLRVYYGLVKKDGVPSHELYSAMSVDRYADPADAFVRDRHQTYHTRFMTQRNKRKVRIKRKEESASLAELKVFLEKKKQFRKQLRSWVIQQLRTQLFSAEGDADLFFSQATYFLKLMMALQQSELARNFKPPEPQERGAKPLDEKDKIIDEEIWKECNKALINSFLKYCKTYPNDAGREKEWAHLFQHFEFETRLLAEYDARSNAEKQMIIQFFLGMAKKQVPKRQVYFKLALELLLKPPHDVDPSELLDKLNDPDFDDLKNKNKNLLCRIYSLYFGTLIAQLEQNRELLHRFILTLFQHIEDEHLKTYLETRCAPLLADLASGNNIEKVKAAFADKNHPIQLLYFLQSEAGAQAIQDPWRTRMDQQQSWTTFAWQFIRHPIQFAVDAYHYGKTHFHPVVGGVLAFLSLSVGFVLSFIIGKVLLLAAPVGLSYWGYASLASAFPSNGVAAGLMGVRALLGGLNQWWQGAPPIPKSLATVKSPSSIKLNQAAPAPVPDLDEVKAHGPNHFVLFDVKHSERIRTAGNRLTTKHFIHWITQPPLPQLQSEMKEEKPEEPQAQTAVKMEQSHPELPAPPVLQSPAPNVITPSPVLQSPAPNVITPSPVLQSPAPIVISFSRSAETTSSSSSSASIARSESPEPEVVPAPANEVAIIPPVSPPKPVKTIEVDDDMPALMPTPIQHKKSLPASPTRDMGELEQGPSMTPVFMSPGPTRPTIIARRGSSAFSAPVTPNLSLSSTATLASRLGSSMLLGFPSLLGAPMRVITISDTQGPSVGSSAISSPSQSPFTMGGDDTPVPPVERRRMHSQRGRSHSGPVVNFFGHAKELETLGMAMRLQRTSSTCALNAMSEFGSSDSTSRPSSPVATAT